MKEEFRMRKLFCVMTVLVVASGVAQADVYYNSQVAWNASVPGATTINFEGIAASGGNVSYGYGPGSFTNVGGVTFAVGPAGTDNILFVVGDNVYYPVSAITPQATSIIGPPNDLMITLPSSVTAVGFNFGSIFVGDNATITLSDGSVQTVAVPASPGLAFFGAVAPGGITSVDITLPADTFGLGMTDFSYGTAAAATPEPSFVILLGVGLAGVIGIVRRRQRASLAN
jgi:hypothetical protein